MPLDLPIMGKRNDCNCENCVRYQTIVSDPELNLAYWQGRSDAAKPVRELHKPNEAQTECVCCWCEYPCPTIAALDEAGGCDEVAI